MLRLTSQKVLGSSRVVAATTRGFASVPQWATMDPHQLGVDATPYDVSNCVGGKWTADTKSKMIIPHPLDKDAPPIFTIPDTQADEVGPFLESLRACSKTGLHNPLKNPERYVQYGEISRRAGDALMQPDIAEFFTQSIIKCVPKSHAQAMGEVAVTAAFLNNFGGDNVRRLAQSFGVPGDHYGQMSVGHRWPYGPVALVTPFNFPLEIPVLQLMGALFMGNKPVLKPSEQVSIVMEQFIKLLQHCGMDPADVDFLNCKGPVAQKVIVEAPVRVTQFTGSSKVGEMLSAATHGKVKLEDAGFDWKIIGPDVDNVDYVAWQCDQDAYASIGQKCSAQSIVFIHENWKAAGLVDKMQANAAKRTMDDFTVGPVLTNTTQKFLDHTNRLASIPGAKVLWGGKELANHNIPEQYGAVEPTAVFVPLEEMMKEEHFDDCTTELFAPFQVVTFYNDDSLDTVLEATERMSHHLTAAVVSNDPAFQTKVLANTVNGTTYAGRRARTTGAPQNHWFGPAGDPRGAGIGTPEAIKLVWSCHREIINDNLVPAAWSQPKTT
ncbi:Delta-1-pyrroline-5-carboxylate dehydrogenase 12A1, mitochondrial [Seminavis robusta]|uniref:Delta-1-pyrroline-5-carboxylate dehydrogenase 12A1, mitochondrial n=1 Tax=Seminavis robusta TaxID=568900 RepID=A0A9N8EC04_9STRA|nr:Delta-1-pyrroline-5-carboxylate dehydrogenase 12A1, mitochondrial [Seminavis robusta]|eukprot:Sro727_g193600.1 Delta-1-pyrroline-5-carboxylate dehydrogenase 12A1, mitochondrial (551) ;mRNA; f:28096-29872